MADIAGAGLAPRPDSERARLEAAVSRAEGRLLDAEVATETLRVELAHFAHAHHERLGALYHRLDELDAEVAEAVALRTGDPADLRRAREARTRLEESTLRGPADRSEGRGEEAQSGDRPADRPADPPERLRIRPTKQAQRLYRDLARRAHPDLAQDPAEKTRREEFIRRVNDAYGDGDLDQLERLGAEWAAGPDSAPAASSPDRVEWLRTRLSWLRSRLAELRREQAELEAGPIGQLLCLDPTDPDGLLERLGEQLAEQVAKYEQLLRRANEIP